MSRGLNAAPPIERFVQRIDIDANGCWVWTAGRTHRGPRAYAQFTADGRTGAAHRWSYEHFHGPVPEGLVLDHLCRNTLCVNPDHLEPVTNRENILRGVGATARAAAADCCPKGHPYYGENLRIHAKGWRICRTCQQANARARYRKAGAR